MKLCSHCGTQNQPDARFCASCGLVFTDEPAAAAAAPPAFGSPPSADDVAVVAAPPKRPMNNALVVALLVLLALASAGVTLLLTRSDDQQAATSTTTGSSTLGSGSSRSLPDTIPTTTAASTTSTAVTTTGLPTTTSSVAVPVDVSTTVPIVETIPTTTLAPTTTVFVPPDPQTVLNDQLDHDRGIVEGLVGFWVPQLSAKADGMVADGITYTLADIVAKDQQLRAEFGTVLLFSGEYNYKVSGLYVDIVPQGFGDPDSALGFCTDHGIDRDNCFAKFITHDMSLTSTTKLQP